MRVIKEKQARKVRIYKGNKGVFGLCVYRQPRIEGKGLRI
jgi:hypothetical protein